MNEIKISCCRICRESTWSDKVTFEFDSEWYLYEFCFSLQVTQYGPQTFCKSCRDKLHDYEDFKLLCLQSEEMWKSLAKTVVCSLEKRIEKQEIMDNYDEFDCKQEDDDNMYISDEDFTLTHEDKDEKINEFVNTVKDNLGSKSVDTKPLDQDNGGSIPVTTHGIKNENVNEFVNNLKDKLEHICEV